MVRVLKESSENVLIDVIEVAQCLDRVFCLALHASSCRSDPSHCTDSKVGGFMSMRDSTGGIEVQPK